MAIRVSGECDLIRAKITERLFSSPDESPMPRTLVGDFSGLIDLWQRGRCPKTLSQQW
jgi:hypothetical protein